VRYTIAGYTITIYTIARYTIARYIYDNEVYIRQRGIFTIARYTTARYVCDSEVRYSRAVEWQKTIFGYCSSSTAQGMIVMGAVVQPRHSTSCLFQFSLLHEAQDI
jgi:hypothetical protein